MAMGLMVYGFFSLINIFAWFKNDLFFINVLFPCYYVIFGLLMAMSFCNSEMIVKQYLFLKTTTGRGLFDLFISGMFCAQFSQGGAISILAFILCGLFVCCGLFFVAVGCCFPGMQVKEIDQAKLKAGVAA